MHCAVGLSLATPVLRKIPCSSYLFFLLYMHVCVFSATRLRPHRFFRSLSSFSSCLMYLLYSLHAWRRTPPSSLSYGSLSITSPYSQVYKASRLLSEAVAHRWTRSCCHKFLCLWFRLNPFFSMQSYSSTGEPTSSWLVAWGVAWPCWYMRSNSFQGTRLLCKSLISLESQVRRH